MVSGTGRAAEERSNLLSLSCLLLPKLYHGLFFSHCVSLGAARLLPAGRVRRVQGANPANYSWRIGAEISPVWPLLNPQCSIIPEQTTTPSSAGAQAFLGWVWVPSGPRSPSANPRELQGRVLQLQLSITQSRTEPCKPFFFPLPLLTNKSLGG